MMKILEVHRRLWCQDKAASRGSCVRGEVAEGGWVAPLAYHHPPAHPPHPTLLLMPLGTYCNSSAAPPPNEIGPNLGAPYLLSPTNSMVRFIGVRGLKVERSLERRSLAGLCI